MFSHAVVIGGSLAGLLSARVLSNRFDQVTLVERDSVSTRPESRKGQPQTRHLHGLLAHGFNILKTYFPDLSETLEKTDIFMGDMASQMRWYTHGGYRKRFPLGLTGVTLSRPFLESLIRERVLALPNVTLMDQSSVEELTMSDQKANVEGLVIQHRDRNETTTLSADLVIDCAGRASRTPRWLEERGFKAPEKTEVKIDIGYATRVFNRDPQDPRGNEWFLVTPEGPRETRFGGLFAIEQGRWIVSMGGWGGDHCPTDEQGFMEFAKSLPGPDIYEIISTSKPLSEILAYKYPSSVRYHYDRLKRFPEGLLVLGDAIASFNPTYGQGMTSAAMQAQELDRTFEKHGSLERIASRFFSRACKIVDMPWNMAVGEDFRFQTTQGKKPLGIDWVNRYVARVNRASQSDEVVCAAFLRVMNLLEPPSSLFHPRILRRVLGAQGRASQG